MLSFSEALTQLRSGKSVHRKGWNGKGLRVTTQVPDSHSKMGNPYNYITCSDGINTPWVPSQTDIFANDWCIYEVNKNMDLCARADNSEALRRY